MIDPIAQALGISEDKLCDWKDHDALFAEYKKNSVKVPGTFEGWKEGEMTKEHRKNLSIAASKRKRTPEHIAALHAGRRGKKNSPEHNAAILKTRIGAKPSKETREKMSKAKKGKKLSTNHKEKVVEHLSNLHSSAGKSSQQKRKESGYYQSEAWRQACLKSAAVRKANREKKAK